MIASTKNEFLHEKAFEKKTLQNMISKVKSQTNQLNKQTRQLANGNKQIEEETFELDRACLVKSKKAHELERQNKDQHREIMDLETDCEELQNCKVVLEDELKEEQAY